MNIQMPTMPIDNTEPQGMTAEAVNAGGAMHMPRNVVEFNARGGAKNAMRGAVREFRGYKLQKEQQKIFEQLLSMRENGARMFAQGAAKLYGPEVVQYFPPTDLYLDPRTGQPDYLEWYKRATVGIAEFSKDKAARQKEQEEAEKQSSIQQGREMLSQPMPSETSREQFLNKMRAGGAIGKAPGAEIETAAGAFRPEKELETPPPHVQKSDEDLKYASTQLQKEEDNLRSIQAQIKSRQAAMKDPLNPQNEQMQGEIDSLKEEERTAKDNVRSWRKIHENMVRTGSGTIAGSMRTAERQIDQERAIMTPELMTSVFKDWNYTPTDFLYKIITRPEWHDQMKQAFGEQAFKKGMDAKTAEMAFKQLVDISKQIISALKGANIEPTNENILDTINASMGQQ